MIYETQKPEERIPIERASSTKKITEIGALPSPFAIKMLSASTLPLCLGKVKRRRSKKYKRMREKSSWNRDNVFYLFESY